MPAAFRYLYFILLLILSSLFAGAQNQKFIQFSVTDGLPSATVYSVMQDSRGYIWFGTESGMSRYNGMDFKNYSIEDGLPDNDVFTLTEDNDQKIWIWSLSELAYIKENKVRKFDNSDRIQGERITYVAKDNNNEILVLSQRTTTFEISRRNSETEEWTLIYQPDSNPITTFVAVEDTVAVLTHPLFKTELIVEKIFNGKKVSIKALGDYPGRSRIIYSKKYGYLYNSAYGIGQINGKIHREIVSRKDEVFKKNEISFLVVDLSDNLWVGTFASGIYMFEAKHNFKKPPIQFLSNRRISCIEEDDEGNMWFTTLGDGVFFLSNKARNCQNINSSNGLSDDQVVSLARSPNGNILAGLSNSTIHELQGDQSKKIKISSSNAYSRVKSIIAIDEQTLLAGMDDGLVKIQENNIITLKHGFGSIKSLAFDEKYLWVASSEGMFSIPAEKIKNLGKQEVPRYMIYNRRTNSVYFDHEKNVLWFGNNVGLWNYHQDSIYFLGKDEELFNYSISSIDKITGGPMVVATYGKGIILHTADKNISIKESDGLSSNICNDLYLAGNSIWVATNKGLTRIQFDKSNYTGSPHFSYFNESDGLLSNEINAVLVDQNKVYIGTKKGLSILDTFALSQAVLNVPKIYIESVKINERDTIVQNQYDLSYDQNNIKISFHGISYASLGKIRYRHQLVGLDKDPIYSEYSFTEYPSLPSGEYIFNISASDKFGNWSAPQTIKFTIATPYYKSLWFLAMMLVTFSVLAFLLYKRRIQQVRANEKEKSHIKEQMAMMEQKALRAQMNPHFIYNALNSIQYFILQGRTQDAMAYLSEFGSLIRMILENSKQQEILLSEEITLVQHYLDLEKMRFEDRLQYQITIDPNLDADDLLIPIMMIQPFVENSIRHGIMHKENGGLVSVDVHQNGDSLVCEITDDGIGRANAKKIENTDGYKGTSTGIKVTQDRFKMLNSINKQNMKMEMEDLFDENSEPSGTKIIISVPVKNKW